METKAKIKVIKKESQSNFKKAKTRKAPTANTAAREMVSTIAGWVSEFQQKRRVETKEAVKLLFDVRHPNGCANC